jgi:hypothetical protein
MFNADESGLRNSAQAQVGGCTESVPSSFLHLSVCFMRPQSRICTRRIQIAQQAFQLAGVTDYPHTVFTNQLLAQPPLIAE